ncbi:DNA-protecting protein DprA [Granulicella sp. 5B5]|uniref:DNA-processing protein DprA n=1 Tax=Granulicella sp. 5B5 TaxID=1617967 RepID=UPI0015F4B0B1|nr:DNA-processing protein DprA [Granulicella sp. 5B5]QMV18074.1 DNA-protecting protein DprA [Granulicella sp. 5B5]
MNGSLLNASEEARLGWLAAVLTPGLGPTRSARMMQRLGGAERVFSASLTELEGTGIPAAAAQFIADGQARKAAMEEAERTLEQQAVFLTPEDAGYPERLLNIYDPPAVLWVRGDVSQLTRAGIAVVGTRHPSPYGAGMAEMLSRELALRGMVVMSGMARGVDTCAHKGALDANGVTVAVWGTGIDVIYPKENKKLAEQIVAQGGAVVSEFPLGTFPAPQNFPIRNRTLSGLSVGVLVVEAAEYSGTRITARCALEQGRDVYAVPGNATNKNSWGPNTLIKQGAKLTATWEDIWEDLPSQVRVELEDEIQARTGRDESSSGQSASLFVEAGSGQPMSEHERLVIQELRQDEAVQLDTLIERLEAKLVSGEIFTALFELEIAGRVRQMPGKKYVRCF